MTLLRTLILIAVIAALSLGLAWLMDRPGIVTIDWRGYRIETSLLFMISAIGFLVAAILTAIWATRKVVLLPSLWVGNYREQRFDRGLAVLTEAMAAVALADLSNAKKQTERAAKYLGDAPVMHLLSAQVARLEGDEQAVRVHLEAMLENPETEFAATRGLLEAARRKQNWAAAASLGERALMIRPKDRWSVMSLMDVYVQQQRWADVLGLLERALRRRAITRADYNRYYALTHFLHGQMLQLQGQLSQAENSLQYAMRRLPEFSPAVEALIRVQRQREDLRGAAKTRARAPKYTPNAIWTCGSCKHTTTTWVINCPSCGDFDSLK